MTLIRGSDGIMHSVFATTSTEDMSNCGVFYKKHMRVHAGVVTCLRCTTYVADNATTQGSNHG